MQLNLTLDDSATCALRQITPVQFLFFGTRQVAYLKVGMLDGEQAFLIYGADGARLEVVDSMDAAMQVVAENGLWLATGH
jgi:hypothetical protein